MTQRDIEKEINEKYVKWSKQRFDLVKLPTDIIDVFKEAIFFVPPSQTLLTGNDISEIISKEPEDLTIVQVGHVINAIMSVPPFHLYKDLAEYLYKGRIYPSLGVSYNKMVEDKKKVLGAEANSKMRLLKV